MISRYFFTMKNGSPIPDKHGITTLSQLMRYHPDFVTENWQMCTVNDAFIVDDVVLYEAMESGMERVSRRIGLDHNIYEDFKTIQTKSNFRPRKSQSFEMSENERSIIYNMCIKEFETLGYDPAFTGTARA
jgi:hypothetical protein